MMKFDLMVIVNDPETLIDSLHQYHQANVHVCIL